jgi:hypothetical protein
MIILPPLSPGRHVRPLPPKDVTDWNQSTASSIPTAFSAVRLRVDLFTKLKSLFESEFILNVVSGLPSETCSRPIVTTVHPSPLGPVAPLNLERTLTREFSLVTTIMKSLSWTRLDKYFTYIVRKEHGYNRIRMKKNGAYISVLGNIKYCWVRRSAQHRCVGWTLIPCLP